uniref:Uncharacterized protein n=1 Tax=Rhizophora mucronata TaxID=61149 RepID=A0A2P2R5B7_RHIMU
MYSSARLTGLRVKIKILNIISSCGCLLIIVM